MKSIFGYTFVGLILAALFAVFMALSVLLTGFTISTLWGWFVTPVFTSVPTLGVLQAAGLSMAVRMFTYTMPSGKDLTGEDEDKTKKFIHQIAFALAYPLVALVFGWILHLFV